MKRPSEYMVMTDGVTRHDYERELNKYIDFLEEERYAGREYDKSCDLQPCPNCGSDKVESDGTGSIPFLECLQCDHSWIP